MRRTRALILITATLGLSACGGDGSSDSAESSARVDVKTFMFRPDPIEVERGTTVEWVNADETEHTVTGDGFDAPLTAQGGTFEHTFERPGRHRYVCTIHSGPGMEAEVIVR